MRVSGTSPVSLELVTSTEFTYAPGPGGDPDVVFLESDTLWVDLPTVHDRTYPVRPNLGFAVRLTNPDTATALVNVQVWLDGSLKYDLEDYPLKDSFVEFSRVYRTGGE